MITSKMSEKPPTHEQTQDSNPESSPIEELRRHHEQLEELVKQLKDRVRELEKSAATDFLTGVSNRNGFNELISKVFPKHQHDNEKRDRSRRNANAVLMLDIDNFKTINDGYGHPAGDRALQEIAAFLKKCTRPYDIICRYGGEEFLIVFRNATAQDIIDKFYNKDTKDKASISVPVILDGQQTHITFSGGVADWKEGDDLNAVIAAVDEVLYDVKSSGKNRIEMVKEEKSP